jgi:diguanylate cyclase (GGDEF)-like protein
MGRVSDRDREWMREAQALSRVRAVAADTLHVSPRRLMVVGILSVAILTALFLTGTFTAIRIIDEASVATETERASIALAREFGEGAAADAETADLLDHAYSLSGARFTAAERLAPDEISVALPAADRRSADDVVLAWTPRRYGSEVFEIVAPFRITVAGLAFLVIAFVLYRLHRLARELDHRRMLAHELASRDVLTGLRNRLTFDQELRDVFAGETPHPMALLFLDLDAFKPINDTLGHAAGDELLRQVGSRLAALVGKSDTLARLGGDEFAIIRREGLDREQLDALAAEMEDALAQPFILEGVPATIGVSIGIAVVPEMARNSNDLVRAADTALYRAKAEGGSRHSFATLFVPRPALRRRAA